MLIKVDHIDVRVPDLAKTVAFFETTGLRVLRRNDARKSVEMAVPGDGVVFEIREDAALEKSFVHHVAFKSDDIAQETNDLKDRGLPFSRELALIEDTGRTISYFNDPGDGIWQLID
jgi:methylmalonyl-CoA/ethylmalonyl-CoA epimerase